MASLAPFVPGLEIRTRFARATTPQTANLYAYIFGPSAYLLRYSEPAERELGNLGAYAGNELGSAASEGYAWPSLPLGATIDDTYTRLFARNARLRYYADGGGATFTRTGLNKIAHASLSFAKNSDAYPAAAAFGDAGVRLGDRIRVSGLIDNDNARPFVLNSYVTGFEGVLVTPAGTGTVAETTNAALTVAGAAVVASGAVDVAITSVSSATSYVHLTTGTLNDTYVVSVIQASTGGNLTTARLSVTSAKGDNVASVIPAAYAAATTIGTRGLTLTLTDTATPTDVIIGNTWTITVTQAYTPPVLTLVFDYEPLDSRDRQYLFEVIQSGLTTQSPVVRVTELNGLDQSRTHLPFDGSGVFVPFAIGSYGITMSALVASKGLVIGDRWIMTAKAAQQTAMRTLVLAHNLPLGVVLNDTDAEIGIELFIADDIEIPRRSEVAGEYNFSVNNDELTVVGTLEVTHPNFTVSGSMQPLQLVVPGGSTDTSVLYLTYRAWYPVSATLLAFSDPANLATLLGGPGDDPDNPLKYALSKAALTADGNPIYYFSVGDPANLAGWSAALRAADDTRETYGLVPLTRNTGVLDLVAGHVNSRSGPLFNMPRTGWFTNEDETEQRVLSDLNSNDEEFVTATITDNPDQSGTQFELLQVVSDNASFVTLGVRAGDVVRYGFSTDLWGDVVYAEYVIERVLNESSLILRSGPAISETIGKRMEINRTLTTEERVQAFTGGIDGYTGDTEIGTVSSAGRYPGQLFQFLASGYVLDGTRRVPSYHLAAVLAAYRSALAPHQAMTRLAVPGFSSIEKIREFSTDQLNRIAGAGGFLVVPDIRTGSLVVRHGITAGNFDDVNIREESIRTNVDSIKGYLFTVLDPYIGQTNVTTQTLGMIAAEMSSARSFLQGANASQGLGGQLIDLTIVDIRQSPVSKDSILVVVEIEVPGPTNRIRLDLLVI